MPADGRPQQLGRLVVAVDQVLRRDRPRVDERVGVGDHRAPRVARWLLNKQPYCCAGSTFRSTGAHQRAEHVVAVALELRRADAGDRARSPSDLRLAAGDLRERRVVEDDVRRHLVRARALEPPCLQRGEDRDRPGRPRAARRLPRLTPELAQEARRRAATTSRTGAASPASGRRRTGAAPRRSRRRSSRAASAAPSPRRARRTPPRTRAPSRRGASAGGRRGAPRRGRRSGARARRRSRGRRARPSSSASRTSRAEVASAAPPRARRACPAGSRASRAPRRACARRPATSSLPQHEARALAAEERRALGGDARLVQRLLEVDEPRVRAAEDRDSSYATPSARIRSTANCGLVLARRAARAPARRRASRAASSPRRRAWARAGSRARAPAATSGSSPRAGSPSRAGSACGIASRCSGDAPVNA